MNFFFPTTAGEMKNLGIKQLDIIIVSGEAYIDHPSSGVSLIAHLLRSHGYTVGIIDQPDWNSCEDFKRLGKPRLFFGITSGNIDSMLANYTPVKKKRHDERCFSDPSYSKPDRAVIYFSNRVREAYKDVIIVIGGVEASLRRLAHYDYWSDSIRRSVILDSRADILVYGMGERQIIEIASRIESKENLDGIRGTVIRHQKGSPLPLDYKNLPSFKQQTTRTEAFSRAYMMQEYENSPERGKTLIEEYDFAKIIHYPPAIPLTSEEMDFIYELPFARDSHPKYKEPVKALEPVLFSVITHRGCFGGCSFCSLGFHQGKTIQSRTIPSILRECSELVKDPRFKGYIDDLGGPTANMYGMNCQRCGRGKDFLTVPSIIDKRDIKINFTRKLKCKNNCTDCSLMVINHNPLKTLLREIRKIKEIKKAFIRSGVRYDLALKDENYLQDLLKFHTSGQLKVAPEHVSENVLKLMNKPPVKVYNKFSKKFYDINKKLGKKQYLIPYLITSHPGSGNKEAEELRDYITRNNIAIEQTQIFTPTPMTRSTCMYYTGKDPLTDKKVYVPKDIKEKEQQKKILSEKKPYTAKDKQEKQKKKFTGKKPYVPKHIQKIEKQKKKQYFSKKKR